MFKKFLMALSVFIMSFFVGYGVLSWTEPASTPPAGNVSAPINTGSTAQGKTGNLGIGTTTPGNLLHSYSSANSGVILFKGENPNTGTAAFGRLDVNANDSTISLFAVPSNYATASVADAAQLYTADALHLDIRQATASGDIRFKMGTTDKVVIDNSGNVGIGATTPTSRLEVGESGAKTTTSVGIAVGNTATSSTASINKYGLYVSSTGTWNGASAKNYGVFIEEPTGGTNNYALATVGGNVGIGVVAPTTALDVNGIIQARNAMDWVGVASPGGSAAGEGRIYFDSTANRFKVSENAGTFQYLITYPTIFYKQYCCWRCHGSNNTGTPDSCSATCVPPACYTGDTDYGIHGVMTGGGVTTTGNPSQGSVKYGVYFNGYGYYYRLCATTKPVYETSCCWRCHASDTTGKPTSCTHTCVPPACNVGDTDLSVPAGTPSNIALGGSISIMGPIGGINTGNQQMNMYALGYGHSIRNCQKN